MEYHQYYNSTIQSDSVAEIANVFKSINSKRDFVQKMGTLHRLETQEGYIKSNASLRVITDIQLKA